MSRIVPTTAPNASTPSYTTVNTVGGFTQGDYVYQKNGDFARVPDNGLSTGSFNISATTPIGTNDPNTSNVIAVNYSGGNRFSKPSAKLTSGNVVSVFFYQINGYPRFKITDADNGSIVNETTITTSPAMNGTYRNIGVLALTGGGFVVFWQPDSNASYVTYAIYSNTGTVVLAPTTDTATNLNSNSVHNMYGVGMPDGGFIICANNISTSVVYYARYDSTGTRTVNWVSVQFGGTIMSQYSVVVARPDGQYIFFCITSDNSTVFASRYTGGNSSVGVETVMTSSATFNSVDAAILSNGDTVVVVTDTTTGIRSALYKADNTISSAVTLESINAGQIYPWSIDVGGMANGTFVITTAYGAQNVLSQGQVVYGYNLCYGVYNNAMTRLQGITNISGTAYGYNNNAFRASILDLGTNASIYWTHDLQQPGTTIANTQVNLTTYAVRNWTSATSVVGSTTASTSGYVRNSSTPMAAAYYAATTQTLTASVARTTAGTATVTRVNSTEQCIGFDCCYMINGDIVFFYQTLNSPTNFYRFSVYSSTGVFIQTVTVAQCYWSGGPYNVKCVALPNGKLALMYNDGNGQTEFTIAYYSSSYSLLTTSTLSGVRNVAYNGSNYSYGMAALNTFNGAEPRVVVAYGDSGAGYAYAKIFNSGTGALVATYTDASSNNASYGVNVVATANGGFVVTSLRQANNYPYRASYMLSTSPDVWYQISSAGVIVTATRSNNNQICTTPAPSGSYITTFNTSAGYASVRRLNSYGTQITSANYNLASTANMRSLAIATTAAGNLLWVASGSVATGIVFGVTENTLANAAPSGSGDTNITLSSPTGSDEYGNQTLVALNGNNALFAYIDNPQYLSFWIFNHTTQSYSQSITAGSTVSTTTLGVNPSNGYVLTGIATTTAAPNSTGTIQTSGAAQLNSNYSASTAYSTFDAQTPGTLGVRGTVVGRNVNLLGTS